MHNLSSSKIVATDDSPRHTSNFNDDIESHEDETSNERVFPHTTTTAVTNGAVKGDQEKLAIRTQSAEGPAPNSPPPDAPPDGGLRAWSTVVGAFCGMFVSFGWISCALFYHFHMSKLQVG
jgi:hypothetical protein